MNMCRVLFIWLLPLLFSISSTTVYAAPARLSVFRKSILRDHETQFAYDSNEFESHYHTQVVDHFNYRPQSYATFQQWYVINYKYWGGARSNAPIFVYLGEEAPLEYDIGGIGFFNDNAAHFQALLVYIEHRYYGKSIPFGTMEEAMKNSDTRGYFNSAQAIADYADVILYVKKKLSAHNSPVIVVGGSYGGMLASWFRLKYPHIALGALASSAPILYFDNITPQDGYFKVVTKDFREASESCYETIRKSWSEIDRVASLPNGLLILSQTFRTCSCIKHSSALKNYLESIYTGAAQYNHPPEYPVTMICGGIDGAAGRTDILGQIFEGFRAYIGNSSCYNIDEYSYSSETDMGWSWQTCSEMVMPIGRGINDTMFPPSPFNLKSFINNCQRSYGVAPRPHWITTYYGGHDIKMALHRFGSNIIFSNGLRDPYSSGGVTEDISDSILAVYTANGSHCLDLHPARKDDPQWLVMQRQVEVNIIEGWIKNYYADLVALQS